MYSIPLFKKKIPQNQIISSLHSCINEEGTKTRDKQKEVEFY